MNKHTIRWIALGGIGILAAIFILYRLGFIGDKPVAEPGSTAAAGPGGQAPPLTVEGFIVKTGELADNIEVSGSTIPEEEVQITSEIAGKVAAILFKEGKRVEKGAVLLRINDEEWKAQREKTRSAKAPVGKDRWPPQGAIRKRRS
ncbi:MAG: biotin/lipoyl-binding protein [Saprospirales bacterium]|nr:biotin/lipoyl-binding protein [Saprospirales bacterium]